MLTTETKELLSFWQRVVAQRLDVVRAIAKMLAEETGERDMTSDFVWGNMTLAELERLLPDEIEP